MPRVIRKKLGKNVLGHANDDNTILIDKSVKKIVIKKKQF